MLSLSTVAVDSNLFRMAGKSKQVHSFDTVAVLLFSIPIRVHSFAETTIVCLEIA